MSEGINFSTNNARFVNSQQMQTVKSATVENVATSTQQVAIKNTTEFVNQSAKSLYQFFSNMQTAQLQNSEMSLVLKDILNMQQDIETFLMSMTDSRISSQLSKADVAQILMSSDMDLSKLMTFMQQNGKEALNKLFSMSTKFAQAGTMGTGSQMSELIAVLNACTPKDGTSQIQNLKNMMLLYLPWLPLGEQNFSIETGKNGSDENSDAGEDSVTILIKTINFGNVKVSIYKNEHNLINFHISAGESFPIEKVTKLIKEEANNYNVQTEMNFEKKEKLTSLEKGQNGETKISVNTSCHINPFLILMAQTIVRIIIGIDKNLNLLEIRKSKL